MRGGKREGAGRPPSNGEHTKRRRVIAEKGTALIHEWRRTGKLTQEQVDRLQPCDVMRMVMVQGVEQRDMQTAFMAAAALAPYMHPKLATTTVKGDASAPLLVEQAVKLVDERKPVELFLNEWQPKLIEGEAD